MRRVGYPACSRVARRAHHPKNTKHARARAKRPHLPSALATHFGATSDASACCCCCWTPPLLLHAAGGSWPPAPAPSAAPPLLAGRGVLLTPAASAAAAWATAAPAASSISSCQGACSSTVSSGQGGERGRVSERRENTPALALQHKHTSSLRPSSPPTAGCTAQKEPYLMLYSKRYAARRAYAAARQERLD